MPAQNAGMNNTYNLYLPSVMRVTFLKQIVSVRMPDLNIKITVSGRQCMFIFSLLYFTDEPHIDSVYDVPIMKKLTYDLRERIFHNHYKAVHSLQEPFYFGKYYGENFPIILTSNQTLQIIDPYTKNILDYFYYEDPWWMRITRVSDINSTSVPGFFFHDDYCICPTDSKRNMGRKGMFTSNVIELGSIYHQIVPKYRDATWFKYNFGAQLFEIKAKIDGITLIYFLYNFIFF